MMIGYIKRWLKRFTLIVAVSLTTFLVIRAWDAHRGDPLEPWHTFIPKEMKAKQLNTANWSEYLKAEASLFEVMQREVIEKLPTKDRVPFNRYFAGSPIYPNHFSVDWNRSYSLIPDEPPRGAAVLLHGLTDSPYSLRHIAHRYHELGWIVIAPRLPAHGTAPAALTKVEWKDWVAATRLAVREAIRHIEPNQPLHLVGFSNGGTLALKYALDALEEDHLRQPDRLILISPMIGITAFARFAGIAGWPAIFPAFARAAWMTVLPEFNPFKYNSFPVNGARQSFQITQALQRQIDRLARSGQLTELAPVTTFQSAIDFTVSTRAIVDAFYTKLPANGSELVLFDLNRSNKFGPLLRSTSEAAIADLLPDPPRNFRSVIITNLDKFSSKVIEQVVEARETHEKTRQLNDEFPPEVFSLSHVALPFPLTDTLYGLYPDPSEDFGVHLGAIATRGERGILIVSLDALLRMSSNPFFPYMLERIEETIHTTIP